MLLFSLLLFSLLVSPSTAYPRYKAELPNAAKVVDGDNNAWPGVGHKNRGGGGARNQFGLDFAVSVSLR
jgi:hypothetical protein